MDPFGCVTLAGCAMKVFQILFLSKDAIALTHKNALLNQYKAYSTPSIHPSSGWNILKQAKMSTCIMHKNHGEFKFGPYYVDGYYELNGDKIALEFLGFVWHGHCCSFNPNKLNPVSKTPFGVLRRQSDNKLEVLRNTYNLKVITVWECMWEKAKQIDPDVRAFMRNYAAPERLNPRDSLFSGCTNALKLYHKAGEGRTRIISGLYVVVPFCAVT